MTAEKESTASCHKIYQFASVKLLIVQEPVEHVFRRLNII